MPEWQAFAEWAWARHHNVLSWYIRPSFLIPFCWFAWRRSALGIGLTLIALATSMFWFPAPQTVSPEVEAMLAGEMAYLTAEWSAWKIAIALLVPASFAALGAAFWRRSLLWGAVVANLMVLIKIVWTFVFTPEGAMAHLVPAVVGLAVIDAAFLIVWRRGLARQSAP